MNRPGFHTSEFIVTALAVLAAFASAAADYLTDPQAAGLGIGAAVAFILSRGLAKYETRTTSPPPPPTA